MIDPPASHLPRGGSTVGPAPGDLAVRTRILLLLVFVLLGGLALRLIYVQGIDPTGQAAAAMDQRLTRQETLPQRGSILDRDGDVLAASVRRYDIVVDQRLVKDFNEWDREARETVLVDVDSRLASLAEVLGMSEEQVREATIGSRPYAVVRRSVTPEVRDKAMALKVPGLLSEAVDRRTYPNGSVAGSIIGFMGGDGTALEGLELSQDDVMTGTPGTRTFEVGADGIRIPNAPLEEVPAVDGADLRLTVDKDAQWFAQETLGALAAEYDAEWANAVVMDVKTGDVIVMADSATVDPADPDDGEANFRTSTVMSTPYEPGSTGKALPIAAAVDAGKVTATDGFTVPGSQDFDGQTIKDFSPHPTFDMTVAGIYARSYNTGTVQIAEKITDEQRYEYMRSFGVGQPIDLGLPQQAGSVLVPPEQWDGRQRLTTAFGQGYTQTTLHTAQMYQALANGGVLVPARLIDATVDGDGAEKRWESSAEPRRVVSEETAAQMLRMMETVVTQGTSKAAAIPGYRVGGKSSTAEAASDTGKYDGYNFGFTAVAPLDDPRFVVSVSMHRPPSKQGSRDVSIAAATIMEHMLRQADVPATGAEPNDYRVFVDDPQDRPW
ncbi:penicillin-binding protein 2 [Micrococcus luteus]|nr:penicillin-binding protein 2 [Micrococcus luteus]MCK6057574.1 penicillin-binding protein 2 [Micrococcus luteus]MCK6060556.1 penicillin-binding protein 2 [Micrococcus luteus]MCK6064215.1 penicillin-binding protein 2 [Micrococcus luteus]MCK6191716.1 penicillin-binding protein 2 [Micrococcus luteus]MCK6193702.1 penicillin-binding protein 2 [Micrococcus luteus]